jgi:hypothetical protein
LGSVDSIFLQKCNGSLDHTKTLHIHCCHLVANIRIAPGLEYYIMAFLLHFKDDGTKKIKKTFFFLCIIFYQIECVIFSYIPFTFPQTSKCFLSNGTKKMHILASGPELQAVRFGYVILDKN